jgi:riboflavin synthase
MFTGIITALGRVRALDPAAAGRDLRIEITAPWPDTAEIPLGASIACSGCCLTVVARGADFFAADVSAETLARTTLGAWRVGDPVNLERALRVGDELGGHFVSGHVDGTAEAVEARAEGGSVRWRFALPRALGRFVAVKGSIALDGVSLTVNAVESAGDTTHVEVNVIPHTAALTRFGTLAVGDRVNVEVDLLARYVARLMESA